MRSLGVLLALALGTTAFPCRGQNAPAPEASTADVERCVNQHETARLLRLNEQWLDARRAMTRCADESCPIAIRTDCAEWLGELSQIIPTLIVVVERDDEIDEQPVDVRKVRRAETGTRAPVAAGEVVAEAPHRAAQERREAGDRGNPGSAPDAEQDVQGIADRGRGRAGRLRVSSRRFPAFDAVAARGDDQVGRAAEERIPAVAGRARSSRRALQQE